jgi:N-glycosylase/DNA lyase
VRHSFHRLRILGPLDLALTFTCGQAFRWRPDDGADGAWSGVVGRTELRVGPAKPGETLRVEVRGRDPGRVALIRYFRLDEHPESHLVHEEAGALRAIPGFMPLLGLRLLRQDPWEATASFVCSAAANIRKITACVEGIAAQWGEPIPGSTRRAFPGPEVVARAAERDLRSLGLGFRAPYLLESARLIARGDLGSWERLRRVPIAEARAALCDLPGVGPKIADCVLLFGLGRLEAYPVDRWIRRATLELAARRRARDQDLSQWAERLGPSRGYLQQILFHLRRTGGPLPALPSAPRRARSR